MIKNEWNNYQKSNEGNSAKWRIENLDLRQFASKDKTLLDLGANHGEFGVELAKDFKHITSLETICRSTRVARKYDLGCKRHLKILYQITTILMMLYFHLL